jgi:L-malate glycosyltransferase
MAVTPDHATALKATEVVSELPSQTVADPSLLPGVFLMVNSLETGGTERQFVELAQALDRQSFRVELGCLQPKGGFLGRVENIRHFGLGGSLYRLKSVRTRLRLARHLRQTGTAVVQAFDFYTNLTLIPAGRLGGVPVVVGSQRQLGDLLTPWQWRAQLAMFRWADAVVCNSRAAADSLIAQGLPENKIAVIGNGLPPVAFVETEPAWPRQPGQLRVGMIARMNARSKNHHAFLTAAARIKDRHPEVEFVLVGDGPLREGLEQEAEKLGLGDRVRFAGHRQDIQAVLASLDITVLPSASESLSNAIIESMAAGVPVVAYRVGGNPELVGEDRGILLDPSDEAGLATAMERLLADTPMRRECGRHGRRFAQEHFTIENMRARHEELYMELLAKKRWRPRPSRTRIAGSERRTDPVRVAIVAASLRYVGGQSVQADLLARNWESDPAVRAELIVIDPPFPRFLQWVERIPGLRTLVREPFYLAALWRGLKKADVAHIFSASYWSFLIAPVPAYLIARLRGKKTLIHYHSGEARDHLQRFHSAHPFLRRAGLLIVPSAYLVEVFREFGLKSQVVPNVVDLSQFGFRLRRPLRPHLVCTRGFHPYYGLEIIVRAFAEVQKEFPEARLDLVGNGSQEQAIRRLVKDLKLSNVVFAGVATRQEIGGFYDRADIFINASTVDNMPVSIIEAFASGTPVVSTGPEGIRYMVEHERTGLLSPPGDAHALAQNVLRVLREPELATKLAYNAFEESRRYGWPEVRRQWLDVYRWLVP